MAQNSKDTKRHTLQGTAVTSCPCRGVSSRPARPCGPGIVKNVNPHERGRKECPALAPSPFSFSSGRCGRQNHTALHPGNPPFTERNSLARPRPSLGTTRAPDCAPPGRRSASESERGGVVRSSRPRTCSRGQVSRSGVCGLRVKAASGFPRSVPTGAPQTAPPAPLPCGARALAKRCLFTSFVHTCQVSFLLVCTGF